MTERHEVYKGKITGTPGLDRKGVELEGICGGVIWRDRLVFGLTYRGFLQLDEETIPFSGGGFFSPGEPSLDVSLAQLSADTQTKARMQGVLLEVEPQRDWNVEPPRDSIPHYRLHLEGISVKGQESYAYEPTN